MTNMTPEQAALVREAQSFGLQPRHIGGSYVLLSGVCARIVNREEQAMRLVYVFDYCDPQTDTHLYRVPAFLARVICRLSTRTLDYAETVKGY